MDVRWWPVLAAALLAAAAVIIAAILLPLPALNRVLRPLANVGRLTALPLYRKIARARWWALVATTALLVALFGATAVTTARPVGFSSATRHFDATHPLDTMVCVGQPVTDASTAGLLHYYAGQISGYDNQRIGLTSPTLRVVPLTRDYDYAESVFTRFAGLAAQRRTLEGKDKITGSQAGDLNQAVADFSRPVDYVDYAPSVEDILALCLTGFPNYKEVQGKTLHRRTLIYLGYTNIRSTTEKRPSLFSTQQVMDLATDAGVQVNAIARTDLLADPAARDSLKAVTTATGGQFGLYNPAGTATAGADQTDPTLAGLLERIGDNPPEAVLPDGTTITQRSWDYPVVPLTIAAVLALGLCATAAVLRR
jgi:hypothetical protein